MGTSFDLSNVNSDGMERLYELTDAVLKSDGGAAAPAGVDLAPEN
jgi:hypothetical protein